MWHAPSMTNDIDLFLSSPSCRIRIPLNPHVYLHSYETLLVEERQASQEVMAFHRRMEAWASSTGVHTTTTTVAAAHSGKGRGGESATEMPPAVLAYEVCVVSIVLNLSKEAQFGCWVLFYVGCFQLAQITVYCAFRPKCFYGSTCNVPCAWLLMRPLSVCSIMIQEWQLYTHTCIQRFLQQTGGARGGWDEYDHNTFQHIRSKYPVSSNINVKDLCVYMHMAIKGLWFYTCYMFCFLKWLYNVTTVLRFRVIGLLASSLWSVHENTMYIVHVSI